MRPEIKRLYIMILVMFVAALFVILSITMPIVTTGQDFSMLNGGWNGCSEIGKRTYSSGSMIPSMEVYATGDEAQIVQRSITDYDLDPKTTAIVILGPDKTFTQSETDYVSRYLAEGGTVLLADDFGSGNGLLNALGASSRLTQGPFVSMAYDTAPEFSVVTDISPPMDQNVSCVLLNHPTTIKAGSNTTMLMNSSLGWLDWDHDYIQDQNEAYGSFPLLCEERIGMGRLILLSDPSIMINSMLDKRDNAIFVQNLLGYIIPHGGKVLFDESHGNGMDGLTSAGYAMTGMPPLLLTVIVCGFFAFAFFMSLDVSPQNFESIKRSLLISLARQKVINALSRFTQRPERSKGDAVRAVLRRHPDWNEALLRRLVESTGMDNEV